MARREIKVPRGSGGGMFVKYSDATVGEVLVDGVYKSREPSNFSTPEKPQFNHIFEMEDGTTKVLNHAADLSMVLDGVPFGSHVWVTYMGKETREGQKGRYTANIFKVEADTDGDANPF